MKKSDREIMEILEALDATGSAHSAAVLGSTPVQDGAPVRRGPRQRSAGVRALAAGADH